MRIGLPHAGRGHPAPAVLVAGEPRGGRKRRLPLGFVYICVCVSRASSLKRRCVYPALLYNDIYIYRTLAFRKDPIYKLRVPEGPRQMACTGVETASLQVEFWRNRTNALLCQRGGGLPGWPCANAGVRAASALGAARTDVVRAALLLLLREEIETGQDLKRSCKVRLAAAEKQWATWRAHAGRLSCELSGVGPTGGFCLHRRTIKARNPSHGLPGAARFCGACMTPCYGKMMHQRTDHGVVVMCSQEGKLMLRNPGCAKPALAYAASLHPRLADILCYGCDCER
jgi:hypothetical protein